MPFIVDTHLHFYPCYDLGRAFRNLLKNLSKLAKRYDSDTLLAAVLTERHDCCFFSKLLNGTIKPNIPSLMIEPSNEPNCIKISCDGVELYLFSGRQLNTRENIEILALTVDIDIPDGLPGRDVVTRIHDAGGIPVLSWAPGKWFGMRGDFVRKLLESAKPGTLFTGDTTLRPMGWGTPRLMKLAISSGLHILSGSDPLPIMGEERHMGTYGSYIEATIDVDAPVTSLRCALQGHYTIVQVGNRCQLIPWMFRIWRNMRIPSCAYLSVAVSLAVFCLS